MSRRISNDHFHQGDVDQALEEIRALHVHREALAALVIFQEAARREELTLQKVGEIATYLKEARGNSGLRFRPG